MSNDMDVRRNFVGHFDLGMLGDVLSDLKDFLGLSWPELESAIKRGDIRRLLARRALVLGASVADEIARTGGLET